MPSSRNKQKTDETSCTTPGANNNTCVVCLHASRSAAAQARAKAINCPVFHEHNDCFEFQLHYLNERIELYCRSLDSSIHVDFCSGKLAHRRRFGGGRGQAIAKAIGLKQGRTPRVIDATAGLASDAFILATLGCSITMIEQSALLCTLIDDAIERARQDESLTNVLQKGFRLINANTIDYLQQLCVEDYPDVIYLDPMYPEKKKSARVKKSMQMLQRMHGTDQHASQLLDCCLEHAGKRVVVKRPLHAETVNNRKPSTSIKSKNTRYDIYALKKL